MLWSYNSVLLYRRAMYFVHSLVADAATSRREHGPVLGYLEGIIW